MKLIVVRSLGLALISCGALLAQASASASAGAAVSPTPVVAPSGCPVCSCPSVTPSPLPPPLTPKETKALLGEFNKAQRTEMKALEHRQRLEMKELNAAQKARRKEWEGKEREARHAFFKAHPQGPDRRNYVKDFLERRKSLLAMMGAERTQRSQEQEVRRKSLKDDQAAKLKEFQEYLREARRPPENLWP